MLPTGTDRRPAQQRQGDIRTMTATLISLTEFIAKFRTGTIRLHGENLKKSNHAYHAGHPTDARRAVYYYRKLSRTILKEA